MSQSKQLQPPDQAAQAGQLGVGLWTQKTCKSVDPSPKRGLRLCLRPTHIHVAATWCTSGAAEARAEGHIKLGYFVPTQLDREQTSRPKRDGEVEREVEEAKNPLT